MLHTVRSQLASIGVKSENFILLKESIICSHRVLKEPRRYAGSFTRTRIWEIPDGRKQQRVVSRSQTLAGRERVVSHSQDSSGPFPVRVWLGETSRGCGLQTSCYLEAGNSCSYSLIDFRITIEFVMCSWAYGFHSTSHHHRLFCKCPAVYQDACA